MAHLDIETNTGLILERLIVRLMSRPGNDDWTDGDKACETTASAEAAKVFREKNDPIGR